MEGESNYSNMTNTHSYLQTFWWFWTEWRSGNTALICTIIATLSPLHDWYAHSSNGIVFLFFYIYLFCKASEINSEQRKSAFVWMWSEGINNQQPNVVCVCVHYTDNLFDVWQMLNRTVNMSIAYCVWCPIAPVNCLFGQLLQIYMQIRMLTGSRITFCFIGGNTFGTECHITLISHRNIFPFRMTVTVCDSPRY